MFKLLKCSTWNTRTMICGIILPLFIIGCATQNSSKFTVRRVGGIEIKSVVSNNQYPAGQASSVDVNVLSQSGKLLTTGLFAGFSVLIEDVSGVIKIEEVGNRNQGVEIPMTLEKLFIPGNPLESPPRFGSIIDIENPAWKSGNDKVIPLK